MIESLAALVLIAGLVFGPLVWRIVQERREDRALHLRAVIHSAVVRAWKGESLLSVQVVPRTFWRPGRVVLTAPTGSEWLIEGVWGRVAKLVPAEYELVVKPARRPSTPPAAVPVLDRAA